MKPLGRAIKARPVFLLLLAFVALVGLLNVLVTSQRVMLYLFYLPVVAGAWTLPKRDAVLIALVAAGLVVSYVLFVPGKLAGPLAVANLWADLTVWAGILVVTAWLVAALRQFVATAMWNLEQAYRGVLEILSKFIQTVDTDTAAHSVRVSAWSVRISQAMDLPASTVEQARIAGLLHDVGKVEVSVEILRKSAALSDEEKVEVGKHTAGGAQMLGSIGGILAHVADSVEAHHEKYDGSGPKGLKGDAIPLLARIIAAADAFDAMISDRPYRKGSSIFEARDALMAASGTHFDPKVLAALKRVIDHEGDAALTAAMANQQGDPASLLGQWWVGSRQT